MVGDLGVVEDALVRLHPALLGDLVGERRVLVWQGAHDLAHRAEVVLGQGACVGTRVGQHLVLLVQRLGELQGDAGGKAEAAVGLALQAGEVEQQRRQLRGGLGLLGHHARLAFALGADGLGLGLVPQAEGGGVLVALGLFELLVEPAPRVFAGGAAEARLELPVVARLELADAVLALHHHRQRRRLHAAHRGEVEAAGLGVERGHRARAVDADQPVRFGAADRGVAQALDVLRGAQVGEAVADRLCGHRLQPQALHRLLAAGMLGDEVEDQLAFAARVTGVDQAGDVLPLDQPGEQLEAVLCLLDRLDREVGRDHRQVGEGPLAALDLELLGHGELEKVADGRRQDVVVGLEVVLLFREAAQRTGDVLRDGRLFRDDQLLAHARRSTRVAPRGRVGSEAADDKDGPPEQASRAGGPVSATWVRRPSRLPRSAARPPSGCRSAPPAATAPSAR